MKKTFLAAMLIFVASFVGAQTISRLSFGLGGGVSVAPNNVVVKYAPRPMGTFDFGYTLLGGVNESVNLGFRTGLNVVYAQNDLSTVLSERFATTDVYGNVYDYRISSPKVLYTQKQVNLEIPLMFAIENKGFYVNLGLKLQMPLWNTFTQSIKKPEVAVYVHETGEMMVNRTSTGKILDSQRNMSGTATLPNVLCAISAEIGHVWNVNGNNSLGFDLFFDYSPVGFFNNSLIDRSHDLVEVENRNGNDAVVTVRPLTECNNFNFRQFNAGVKFVYAFDIEHKRVL